MNKEYIINEIKKEIGEDFGVEFTQVPKNNVVLNGISIRKAGANIAANIYYDEDWDDDQIVAETLKTYKTNANPDFNIDELTANITDWEYVSSKIIPALYNVPKSVFGDDLVTMPYFGDMGILFKVLVDSNELGTASIKVTDGLLKSWKVTTETLFEIAKKNLNNNVIIRDMQDTLRECFGETSVMERSIDKVDTMSCASNTSKVDGAAVMLLLTELIKNGELDNIDYYIIPSSIHEILMVNPTGMGVEIKPSDLVDMIRDVNMNVLTPQDYLSSYAYKYDAESGEIEVLA